MDVKNPFSITMSWLQDLAHGKNGHKKINALCKELKITNSSNRRLDEKISSIVLNPDLDTNDFNKAFLKINSKSGGILKGVCIHDVAYVHKVCVEPEGPHDYFVVLSMLDPDTAPPIIVIDSSPHVAKYMNNHSGTHPLTGH